MTGLYIGRNLTPSVPMKDLVSKCGLPLLLLLLSLPQVEGVGKVFIGFPPFLNLTSPSPEDFIFFVHETNGLFPVYIEAFNDTNPSQSVPITHDVAVNCEPVFITDGYSSATFQSVTLGSSTNYSNVIANNFVVGRGINVRCYGESQVPPPVGNTNAPQFTKDTSWSNTVLFQVKPSPTVNFCQSVSIVPNQYQLNASNFELEFSDPVEGGINNLNVRCSVMSVQSLPGAPDLAISINTTGAYPKYQLPRNESFVLLIVPYTIQTKGSAVRVQCSAESITGNQYQFSTSEGSSSQFEMETGSVHLYPEFPEFIQSTSPTIKTVISLDSPVSSNDQMVTFLCQASVENNTQDAVSKAETPDCSFTTDTAITTTTAAPTVNATVDPRLNLSLWEVIPSRVEITAGRIYRGLEILRTVDVTDPELELVLVTCCAPSNINNSPKYQNASVALLTSVYLQPSTTNWTLANDASKAYVERIIPNPAYVEVAPCACDVTKGACNVECCCDQDCSTDEKTTFTSCIPGLIGGMPKPDPAHLCNSTQNNKVDWFPLMCVEFQNSAALGTFYSNQAVARTVQSFYEMLFSVDTGYNYRESDWRNAPETNVGTAGYKHGQRLRTAQPTAIGGLSSRSGVLALPQRTIGGQCLRTAPVRFLTDLESDCTYTMTPELCGVDSVLSARMYAEPSGLTSPPCLRTYQVLSVEDSSGKAVSEAAASYFCSPDNTGFLNTPDTMRTELNQYTTSLFDYDMPPENCQDTFGNDICADPENITITPKQELPKCSFDDGYTPAPLPVYNSTTKVCHNAVLSVKYNFTWSGQRIVFLNTTVILGDVPMEVTWQENRTMIYTDNAGTTHRNTSLVNRSTPAILNQKYSVIFHHNYTKLINTSTNNQDGNTRVDRSGYPGYDAGKLILSGKAIVNSTTGAFFYVNSNLTNQMALFDTGMDGLCFNAGKKQMTFQDDAMSTCAIRLDFDIINNCTSIRKLVLNRLNNMMPADRLGRFGFLNSNNDGFWVPVIRQDLSEYFDPAPSPTPIIVFENVTKVEMSENVASRCHDVTTGIQLEVLYGETGKTLGASILEIVGAKISYTLSTWELSCSGASSARCYGNQSESIGTEGQMVEPFYLTTSVRFTRVPAQIPVEPIKFWKSYDEALCPQDSCWRGLFYPLTEEYTGDEPFYPLLWTQVIVFGSFFFFMVTRPWW
ncbi:uncharacterized protein LOC135476300 [Liolophura sinensis]|uniref:uncharacterized protein LOC135476300 n=1 Tax=Liolophura sinensis TaxID=3198878 RepID=UPI003158634A